MGLICSRRPDMRPIMTMPRCRRVAFALVCIFTVLFASGCQKQSDTLPGGLRLFGEVSVEFDGKPEDSEVEEAVEDLFFGHNPIFHKSGTASAPYTLWVTYSRTVALKGLGYMLLSGAIAPIESDFYYRFEVAVKAQGTTLQTYSYTEVTREETNSALESLFNPFHKENGRSVEIFSQLTEKFLAEFLAAPPFPRLEQ